jgi:tRNA G46 methylase TrmB
LLEAVALLLGSSGSGANPSDRTAVVYDFGCGDGRFLVAAAKQPSVSKVVGVAPGGELMALIEAQAKREAFRKRTFAVL